MRHIIATSVVRCTTSNKLVVPLFGNNLAGIDVNHHTVFNALLYHLEGNARCVFAQEPADLFARGHRIQTAAGKPAFIDAAYERAIGVEIDVAVRGDFNVALGVGVFGKLFNSHHHGVTLFQFCIVLRTSIY